MNGVLSWETIDRSYLHVHLNDSSRNGETMKQVGFTSCCKDTPHKNDNITSQYNGRLTVYRNNECISACTVEIHKLQTCTKLFI